MRTRGCEGTQPGQLAPSEQRDITYCMLSYKSWGKKGEKGKGHSEFGICLPKQLLCMIESCFPGMAEHVPAHGK